MASPASLAFQGNHVLNELASAGTDRRMPLACRRRLPPSAASTLFPDDRCFSLPRAARLATAFASIRLGSQGLTQAGAALGMAPMAKPVALTAQKAEVLEASAGRGMQSLTRQEMGHRQQLLSRAQQQRTSYCWTCQVCCPPRLSVGSSTSRGHAAEHAPEAASVAAASQTVRD